MRAVACGAAVSVRAKRSEKATGPPETLNGNDCGSPDGTVVSSTTIWPRFTSMKVQVTVSPGATATAVTGLPSSHVALVRSHAAPGFACARLYVPGRTAPLSNAGAPPTREKAEDSASG